MFLNVISRDSSTRSVSIGLHRIMREKAYRYVKPSFWLLAQVFFFFLPISFCFSSCVVTFPGTLSIPDCYLDGSLTAFDPNLTPRLAVDSSVQCRLAHIKETRAPFCSLTNTICRLICAECRINWAFEEGDIRCFLSFFLSSFFHMVFCTSSPSFLSSFPIFFMPYR